MIEKVCAECGQKIDESLSHYLGYDGCWFHGYPVICIAALKTALAEAEKRAEETQRSLESQITEAKCALASTQWQFHPTPLDDLWEATTDSGVPLPQYVAGYFHPRWREIRDAFSAAESRLRDAEMEKAVLITQVQNGVDLLSNADPEACMCGARIGHHNINDNHAPTTMLEYYGEIWVNEAKDILAALPSRASAYNEVIEAARAVRCQWQAHIDSKQIRPFEDARSLYDLADSLRKLDEVKS